MSKGREGKVEPRTANFKNGITKYPNEINNKLTSTRQHNKCLLECRGYMFRPVNKSSSGL